MVAGWFAYSNVRESHFYFTVVLINTCKSELLRHMVCINLFFLIKHYLRSLQDKLYKESSANRICSIGLVDLS